MNMEINIKKKIEFHLDEDTVRQIIAQYLCQQGYAVKPSDVTLSVENRCEGYGPTEHYVPRFKECTAIVKGE